VIASGERAVPNNDSTLSALPEKTGTLLGPWLEWELANTGYLGNPYDIVAAATFRHVGSDDEITTGMF
jgi:hypothetical protein